MKVVKTYLIFLLIGLLNAIFAEFAIVYEQMIEGYPITILLHTIFISTAFLINKQYISKIKNKFKEYVSFYFIFGFAGLIVIEWILVGNLIVEPNPLVNLYVQIFMFSFWAGVVLIPKLLLDNRFSKSYRKSIATQICTLFALFVGLGAIAYLISNNFDLWLVGVGVFYISLNIVFLKHFLKIKK